MGQCRGRNPEVVSSDGLAATTEVGPGVGMDAGDRLGDRQRLKAGEHVFDESSPACPARTCGTVDAVEQLADCDNADRTLLTTDKGFERGGLLLSLPLDQEIRVDQDGQESSGTSPASRRIRRRSPAKSSSTGGAEAISSPNRSAESSRFFGGLITATGAPPRVTSISSPSATRFNTSEKRRATSVALSRAIVFNVSDKSD